jgi:cytochrome c peroxidase
VKLDPLEDEGRKLFFSSHREGGAGCFECHSGPHFSDFTFRNNGLQPAPDLNDLGRFGITGKEKDKFLFSTPSLRNVAITSPYMHDGRFENLTEVIEHYNNAAHETPTLDPKLKKKGLQLKATEKKALIAFLQTLTDPQFIDPSK